jgi:integrase
MARNKLTDVAVRAAKEPGRYGDGGGLFLLVKPSGARSWVLRVQRKGVRRDFGLGSAESVTLKAAREKARITRGQVQAGLDPLALRAKESNVPTLREAAALVCAEQKGAWQNAKHAKQWLSSLERHAFPAIGDLRMDELDEARVRDVLAAIWLTHNETARRVRQRIVQVVDWAVAKGFREHALSIGPINRTLPRVSSTVSHWPALPYPDVPAFLCSLRASPVGPARLALEFLLLTAARSGEVRLADWSHIDLRARVWTRPAHLMKAKREHAVPLSSEALAVLEVAASLTGGRTGLVFPGRSHNSPLSDMTLSKRMKAVPEGAVFVPHGLRSSFRDWVAEETSFPGDLAEMALAHTIKDKTEAAYRRGGMLEKRRALMDAWAAYCLAEGAPVVRLVVA